MCQTLLYNSIHFVTFGNPKDGRTSRACMVNWAALSHSFPEFTLNSTDKLKTKVRYAFIRRHIYSLARAAQSLTVKGHTLSQNKEPLFVIKLIALNALPRHTSVPVVRMDGLLPRSRLDGPGSRKRQPTSTISLRQTSTIQALIINYNQLSYSKFKLSMKMARHPSMYTN